MMIDQQVINQGPILVVRIRVVKFRLHSVYLLGVHVGARSGSVLKEQAQVVSYYVLGSFLIGDIARAQIVINKRLHLLSCSSNEGKRRPTSLSCQTNIHPNVGWQFHSNGNSAGCH